MGYLGHRDHYKWLPTGIRLLPLAERLESFDRFRCSRPLSNQELYQSITLNGQTQHSPNWTGTPLLGARVRASPSIADGWGLTNGSPYTVYLDELDFTYQ